MPVCPMNAVPQFCFDPDTLGSDRIRSELEVIVAALRARLVSRVIGGVDVGLDADALERILQKHGVSPAEKTRCRCEKPELAAAGRSSREYHPDRASNRQSRATPSRRPCRTEEACSVVSAAPWVQRKRPVRKTADVAEHVLQHRAAVDRHRDRASDANIGEDRMQRGLALPRVLVETEEGVPERRQREGSGDVAAIELGHLIDRERIR